MNKTKFVTIPNYHLPVMLELCDFPEYSKMYEKEDMELEIWKSHSERAYRLFATTGKFFTHDVFEYDELDRKVKSNLKLLKEAK